MRKLRDWQLVGKPSDVAKVRDLFEGVGVASDGDEGLLRLKVEKRRVVGSKRNPTLKFVLTVAPLGGHKVVRVEDKYGLELRVNPKQPGRVEVLRRDKPDTLLCVLLEESQP